MSTHNVRLHTTGEMKSSPGRAPGRDAPSTPTPGAKQYFKKSACQVATHTHLPPDKKIVIPKEEMIGCFMLDIFFYEILLFKDIKN